jgi:hypothetical protein
MLECIVLEKPWVQISALIPAVLSEEGGFQAKAEQYLDISYNIQLHSSQIIAL